LYRTDAANSAAGKPAPSALGTEGYFKNPAGALAGTTVDADWMNALQESLIAILDDQSISHSKTDHTRLLVALRALVDSRISTTVIGLPGYITGLEIVPNIATHAIEIRPGDCRSSDDATTGRLLVAMQKLPTVPWNLTTGGLASNNTWADPYFTRVWAIHKAVGNDINFGFDQDATATNLLSDAAASGFTTARQIGWGVRSGSSSWIPYTNAEHPDIFLSGTVRTVVNNIDVTVTTEITSDLDVPETTSHIGGYSLYVNANADTAIKYATLGQGSAPAASTATVHNFAFRADTASDNLYSVSRTSVSNAGGSATLQGLARSRFNFAPFVSATYNKLTMTTAGFRWSRSAG
jgi:hypothetical protein